MVPLVMVWDVKITGKAARQLKKLPIAIQSVVAALMRDIQAKGPILSHWPHFGKISGRADCCHCHLKSGRPTYVAIWQVSDRGVNLVEILYIGTHEGAAYGRIC
jgi:mRNA-degrading endonuclease RelE of RelBE toxin-antitoxin system